MAPRKRAPRKKATAASRASRLTPALLFVDVLGVKSLWHKDGANGARTAFDRLRRLVIDAVRDHGGDGIVQSGIESDSAALVCSSTTAAIQLGIDIYRRAFRSGRGPRDDRMWLRGVITPIDPTAPLRESAPLSKPLGALTVNTLSDGLLEAVAIEKSGFKGMRLLIDSTLVTNTVSERFALPMREHRLHPFRNLETSYYPRRIAKGYSDVLWMATNDADEWQRIERQMAIRLRWAAHDDEEALQAAATQVVFSECDGILKSMRFRRGRS